MSQHLTVSDHAVVEFVDKGKYQLGFVVSVDTKASKVKLINQLKREVMLPVRQVMHVLTNNAGISLTLPISNIADILTSIELKAQSQASQIDIEELWQLTAEESSEVELDMLVALNFSNPDAEQRLAMIRSLRADRIYFKETTSEMYQLRSADAVADIKRQIAVLAERDAYRERFVDEAEQILKLATASEREEAIENRDHSLDGAYNTIQDYALFGAESKVQAEAELLLSLLQKRLNRGFSGTAHLRARSLLFELGYWPADTNVALLRHDIQREFGDVVEAEAFQLYQSSGDFSNRCDLTALNVFSIDDIETKDIDDALSLERLEGGRLRLGVHIACPPASFAYGSPMELAARGRGTSLYLAEARIPMLPPIVSENALSLMEGGKRAAMSFLITYDAEYNVVDREIVRSVVQSKHRLTYETAEQMLEAGIDETSDDLRTILEITESNAAQRHAAGAIDVNLPENKVVFDAETRRYSLVPVDNSMMSRQLVAECMIIANAWVAAYCAEHEIPVLYRTQPEPSNMPSQEELDAMLNDIIRALSMRRCMSPAVSSTTPGKHAGLGLEAYLQATSPLRRYGDLMVHYQLDQYLQNGVPAFDAEAYATAMTAVEGPLSSANAASREANQYASLAYLQQEREQLFEAMIVQYNPERPDHPQIILLDTQVRATISLRKHLVPGTMIKVRIDNVNPEDGTLVVQFVSEV